MQWVQVGNCQVLRVFLWCDVVDMNNVQYVFLQYMLIFVVCPWHSVRDMNVDGMLFHRVIGVVVTQ